MVCRSDSPLISLTRTAWRRPPLKLPTPLFCQATVGVQHNSLTATPAGSPAPAAPEIPPRHGPLALVAFLAGTTWPQASLAEPLAEAHERFGGGAGAAILFALLAYEQLRPTTPRI